MCCKQFGAYKNPSLFTYWTTYPKPVEVHQLSIRSSYFFAEPKTLEHVSVCRATRMLLRMFIGPRRIIREKIRRRIRRQKKKMEIIITTRRKKKCNIELRVGLHTTVGDGQVLISRPRAPVSLCARWFIYAANVPPRLMTPHANVVFFSYRRKYETSLRSSVLRLRFECNNNNNSDVRRKGGRSEK
jgi:hypothetical protein